MSTLNPSLGAGSEITLRDQIAGQVLATLVGNDPTIVGSDELAGAAGSAYRVANAMLQARQNAIAADSNGGTTP